jgi:hypothetical protein
VFEVLKPIGALRSFQKLRGAAQAKGQVFNLAVKRRRFRAARPLQATTSLLRLAVQDLRARILADLRFRKRLVSPLAAEFGSIGACLCGKQRPDGFSKVGAGSHVARPKISSNHWTKARAFALLNRPEG